MEPEILHDDFQPLVIERKLTELQLGSVVRLRCHPSNPEFVFSDVFGSNVSYYDLASNNLVANTKCEARRFAYNPQGTLRADAEHNRIRVCDLQTNNVFLSRKVTGPVYEVIFNHDGTKLVISLYESLMYVLDISTRKLSETMIDHPHALEIVRSPDGKTFASVSLLEDESSSVALWNLKDQEVDCLDTLQDVMHRCLAFISDGTQLVVGRHDGNINIWDLKNRICKLVQYSPKPHSIDAKGQIAYCARTNTLFSAPDKWTSKLNSIDSFDLKTNKIRFNLVPLVKTDKVLEYTFSDDGSKLAQIVRDKNGDLYFRYIYLLPKKCYTDKERALMAKLCKKRSDLF